MYFSKQNGSRTVKVPVPSDAKNIFMQMKEKGEKNEELPFGVIKTQKVARRGEERIILLQSAKEYLLGSIRMLEEEKENLEKELDPLEAGKRDADTKKQIFLGEIDQMREDIASLGKECGSLLKKEQEAVGKFTIAYEECRHAEQETIAKSKYFKFVGKKLVDAVSSGGRESRQFSYESLVQVANENADLSSMDRELRKAGINTLIFVSNGTESAGVEDLTKAADGGFASISEKYEQKAGRDIEGMKEFVAHYVGAVHKLSENGESAYSKFEKKKIALAQVAQDVASCTLIFAKNASRQVELAKKIQEAKAHIAAIDSKDWDSREIVELRAKIWNINGKIGDLQERENNISRLLETFGNLEWERRQQKNKREEKRQNRERFENRKLEEKEKEGEEEAKLLAEKTHLEAQIENTLPELSRILWDGDKFRFCNRENRHARTKAGGFDERILDMAKIYLEDSKVSMPALLGIWSGEIRRQEKEIGEGIIRVVFGDKKNYRILVDILEEGDPHILMVGTHKEFDKFVIFMRKHPREEWISEWQKGLFKNLLKPAINAKKELVEIEAQILEVDARIARIDDQLSNSRRAHE